MTKATSSDSVRTTNLSSLATYIAKFVYHKSRRTKQNEKIRLRHKKAKKNKTDFAAIKKLLKYARPYVPVIIIALVLSALQIAATLLAPVVVGKTVDYIIGENNVDFGVIFKTLASLQDLSLAYSYFNTLRRCA